MKGRKYIRNNKQKAITIAALVIAVIGLSIGFAAFASTLNISTSASVTPADGNFIVKFSKVNNELNEEDVTPSTGTGDAADIDNTNASNPKIGTLSTTFTQPGQSVEYTFYVRNMGKYDAYLTNIRFNNASTGNSFKVCTATSDNPVSNANDMCQYITYRLTLEDSPSNKVLTSTSDFATTVGNSYYVAKSADPTTGTTNSKMVKVTITYEDGSPFADGAFTVNFGSVELVFASLAGYVPPVATSEQNINSEFLMDSTGTIIAYTGSGGAVVIPQSISKISSFSLNFDDAACIAASEEDTLEYKQEFCLEEKDGMLEDLGFYYTNPEYMPEYATISATVTNQSHNVTAIGAGAFWGAGITSVDFSQATYLTTIGRDSFSDNSIGLVTLPSWIETVDEHAFSNNPLTTIVIGDSVNGSNITTIGKSAFEPGGYFDEENDDDIIYPDITSVTIYRSSTGVEISADAFGNYDISSSWHPVG